jgi:hypothetical protein
MWMDCNLQVTAQADALALGGGVCGSLNSTRDCAFGEAALHLLSGDSALDCPRSLGKLAPRAERSIPQSCWTLPAAFARAWDEQTGCTQDKRGCFLKLVEAQSCSNNLLLDSDDSFPVSCPGLGERPEIPPTSTRFDGWIWDACLNSNKNAHRQSR